MEHGRYCIYLRKSREDREAEIKGEGETLARHRTELFDLAKRMEIIIHEDDVYEEIVSGDSIAARPVMQKLLSVVESGEVIGVLCVDIDRLGRGNMIDQGIIQQTFLYSNTLIITPLKTYDMSDEVDSTTVEFKSLMARQELNMIKRRLVQGREASVREGKWVGSEAPYGYNKMKLQGEKGYTLQINREEAEVVRMIFALYLEGLGANRIARRLAELGIRTNRGRVWSAPSVLHVLKNDVYIGKVHYGRKKKIKVMENGVLVEKRKTGKDSVCVRGIHESIIDEESWKKVRERFASFRTNSARMDRTLKNPFATILRCGKCGYMMKCQAVNSAAGREKRYRLFCTTKGCSCHSSFLDLVEQRFIDALKDWTGGYQVRNIKSRSSYEAEVIKSALNNIVLRIEKLENQLHHACDLLEQGIYSKELFTMRVNKLNGDIYALEEKKVRLEHFSTKVSASVLKEDSIIDENGSKEVNKKAPEKGMKKDIKISKENKTENEKVWFPKDMGLMEIYWTLDTETKNAVLKELIKKAVYIKDVCGRDNEDAFILQIYPRLPKC